MCFVSLFLKFSFLHSKNLWWIIQIQVLYNLCFQTSKDLVWRSAWISSKYAHLCWVSEWVNSQNSQKLFVTWWIQNRQSSTSKPRCKEPVADTTYCLLYIWQSCPNLLQLMHLLSKIHWYIIYLLFPAGRNIKEKKILVLYVTQKISLRHSDSAGSLKANIC